MGAQHSGREVEIKLRVASAAAARRLLRRAALGVARRRTFEDNLVFDTGKRSLRRAGSLLRLRLVRSQAVLTYKGPAETGRHKSREEIETVVADAAAARDILLRLGFELVFRYQKYRTEFSRPGEPGVVTLDETPIGCFFELEGAPFWIDATASILGFAESEYITGSYARLYMEFCRKQGLTPGHMVFGF